MNNQAMLEKNENLINEWENPQDAISPIKEINQGKCTFLILAKRRIVQNRKYILEEDINVSVKRKAKSKVQDDSGFFVCKYEGCSKIFNSASTFRKHSMIHGDKQVHK